MARLMTVGYDAFYGTDAFPSYEYDWNGFGADIFQETVLQRTGPACVKVDSAVANGTGYFFTYWGSIGANGYYPRIYMRFSALPSSTVRIMQMGSAAAGDLVQARLTSAGKLQLWNGTGTPAQIGSDSAETIGIDTYYCIELHCKTAAGANDTAGLRLNQIEVASASGLSLSDADTYGTQYGWLDPPGASKTIYMDDGAFNDDTGALQNSYPGAGRTYYLPPLSDNARGANWVAGAGATTNLFDAVDAGTPAGVAVGSATNTSQIKNTNTADVTGNYDANMQSYDAAGIPAGDRIVLVQSVIQAGNSGATVDGALQIVSNPAQGSEEAKAMGTATTVGSYGTNWQSIWGAAQYNPSVVRGTQPVLRVGRRGTQAAELHVCGMRLAVEVGPGGADVAWLVA